MAPRLHTVLASPLGPLTLVAADGLLCGLYMEGQRHRPAQQTFGAPAPAGAAPFREAAEQLAAYFAGELREFDLPLALEGTAFQRTVWRELCRVPYGSTVTYGQLAERIRSPGSARAVGLANGRNPVGIVVPCHRVVGASGSLTGYGGGLERKRRLLGLEGAGAAGRWSGALW
ncbi:MULTISPECIES: methylated-DNA--[protein]-cysteine S-methyltransferase [Streptomyces]|uniref:Methylated-DNA--protein-cysteine methyltransferase n=1 Tax=Streptomyces cacaoi TaxID=1898 RepID=A0A4Y3QQW2_STRCI|nr:MULTISPECIES: methylated-DNA--[protein]-cysteine S-methyltransferase [Streptomyces]NNG86748.1 methylated-DNA--[protein]-cysteine S-methyltransferase [Streptomyces cacaoi]QHF98664.1 methylated-DNA--[protein]-cysteine S-methyltransferase [Streptomyces sp. NHF165]GEB47774.1 methylated-DNA--protein-cysteine methyltransferase [Streptomyces cacaoi]